MRKILFFTWCIVLAIYSSAQAPQSMDFQSIIRDSKGNLVTNHSIGLRISVLRDSVTGAAVYTETHNAITNNGGLVTVTIGKGITSGDFSIIDWGKGPYFVKTEIDVTGGTNYSLSFTNQMMSVPYALYANSAGNYQAKLDSLERKIASMEPYIPTTHMDGFTVAPGRQVHFAKGYLRKSSSGVYSFSNTQYENLNSSEYFFAWNSSIDRTYANSANGNMSSPSFWDIGVMCRSQIPGYWRILTVEEWNYIIYGRKNCDKLATLAVVNGVQGLLLLPDAWQNTTKEEVVINISTNKNTYSVEQWNEIEKYGAVFIVFKCYKNGSISNSLSILTSSLVDVASGGEWAVIWDSNNKKMSTRTVGEVGRGVIRLVEDY